MSGDYDHVPARRIVGGLAADSGVPVIPAYELQEGGLTELIGKDEQIDTDDYSGSVGVALAEEASGEVLNWTFHTSQEDAGTIHEPAGTLYVFDADPTIASGDVSMTAAERQTAIGFVTVEAADWKSDANGATASIKNQPISFHALSTLYFVWFHEDAASFNDGGTDDEVLDFNFWYRRDS